MVAAVGIRIDAATVGLAPPRGCGQCGYRLYGVRPPCASFWPFHYICRPFGRLSALSVSPFSLHNSRHHHSGAAGCLSTEQAFLTEQQDDTRGTVGPVHPRPAIHAIIISG